MQCTIYVALYKVDIQVKGRHVSGKRDFVESLDMLFGKRGKIYGAFVRFKRITIKRFV